MAECAGVCSYFLLIFFFFFASARAGVHLERSTWMRSGPRIAALPVCSISSFFAQVPLQPSRAQEREDYTQTYYTYTSNVCHHGAPIRSPTTTTTRFPFAFLLPPASFSGLAPFPLLNCSVLSACVRFSAIFFFFLLSSPKESKVKRKKQQDGVAHEIGGWHEYLFCVFFFLYVFRSQLVCPDADGCVSPTFFFAVCCLRRPFLPLPLFSLQHV